ncbi:hypothetical protein FCH28_07490 [Streptomyces piniterrae]|uniref:Zf-HC2 domain-containing protein n=1 Tax=Streptomyces piniterrae TaxID=2571125 RepID=A0A4U0NRQ2_9ACTN|nr:zf-HC2 domain-containing protein [Streptomyces piniterrae]TJZ57269.1 hypothetical protein FCH28_07490 [Streptomyces piniterrae]
MAKDVTCEKLMEIGAELALGVLPGRERAEAVAHLDRCAECREYVGQLTLVGDGLLGLLPDREPPVGFETRVARSLAQSAAARDGRRHPSGPGRARKRSRGRVRLKVASAFAAFALAFGFGGWAVGTAIENLASPSRSVVVGSGLLRGDLTVAGTDRQAGGEVFVHTESPAWMYMSVDLDEAGISYSGKVTCVLERTNGTTVRVGTFALHDGYGYWGAPVPVDPSTISGARLTSADGTLLATAHFETAR